MISRPRSSCKGVKRAAESGFSLMELMIAMTLGLLLSGFMVAIVVNTNSSNQEVDKSNRQIENGRYASELLRDDIRLAGYYGDFGDLLEVPAATPAICPPSPLVLANLVTDLKMPIQSISSAAADALSACPGAPAVVAGTDIIIVRRADTNAVCGLGQNITPVAPTVGDYYLQSTTAGELDVQVGAASGFVFGTTKANGADSTLCKRVLTAAEVAAGAKDNSCPMVSIGANGGGGCAGFTAAAIRKLHVSYYFVSPCNYCAGSARPDQIPTLKRVYLTAGGFAVEPLVEGIENLHIEFGIDNDAPTNVVGYGSPDVYVNAPASLTAWANAVAVRVYILARNVETSNSYTDTKTYVLGQAPPLTPGGAYKRHVFSSLVRIENLAARRETP
jgi:type IV pilus assembly protein PilW